MNILMALSQLEVTGAEVYAVTIANELVAKGHNVFIVSDTLTKTTQAKYSPMPLSKRSLANRFINVKSMARFIKENDIQIVHSHSRASAWVASAACKLCSIPHISTIHGRQATFLSRKLFPGFGNYTLAVCEEIQKQLIREFKIPKSRIEVLRNGFDTDELNPIPLKPSRPVVTYITRLSGPKGELAQKLLEYISNNFHALKEVDFKVIGGQEIPGKFTSLKEKFEFTGYVGNLKDYIDKSTVVIGSGRIAVESILRGKPTIAIGEATGVGLVRPENLEFALSTNFGDMAEYEKVFDFEKILNDLSIALNEDMCHKEVQHRIAGEFNINLIVDRIEFLYQSILVRYYRREVPVIMYHRLVKRPEDAGKHGIYVTAEQFEEHMKYLKTKGYETLDFEEALNTNRFERRRKFVVITFDDGYKDNYSLANPILKKYSFKAVIFLVAGIDYNKWDCQSPGEPKLTFMDTEELREMQQNGIIFGAHTLTHPDLTSITLDEARKEIIDSKVILEEKLGRRVKYFAYPYGKLNEEIKKILFEAGFTFGIATDSGPIGMHEDPFQVRRIAIFPNTTVAGLSRKVKGDYIFRKVKDKSILENIPNKKTA